MVFSVAPEGIAPSGLLQDQAQTSSLPPNSPSRQPAPVCSLTYETGPPHVTVAHWQGLAVSPFEGSGRGVAVLLLLQVLRPEIYKDVAEQWWVEVPTMVHLLEGEVERGQGGPYRRGLLLSVQWLMLDLLCSPPMKDTASIP